MINEINEDILNCKGDELYQLCQSVYAKELAKENIMIRRILVISEAEREESVYSKQTVFSKVIKKSDLSPLEQLSKLYEQTLTFLLRFANDFPDEYLEEALDFFISQELSGDLIAHIAIKEDIAPEKVLPQIASYMSGTSIAVPLRIYKMLQKKYKNPKYYIAAALIYMQNGNFKMAYNVLYSIDGKSPEIVKLLEEIKSKIV